MTNSRNNSIRVACRAKSPASYSGALGFQRIGLAGARFVINLSNVRAKHSEKVQVTAPRQSEVLRGVGK
jgi:hypothetical protein